MGGGVTLYKCVSFQFKQEVFVLGKLTTYPLLSHHPILLPSTRYYELAPPFELCLGQGVG